MHIIPYKNEFDFQGNSVTLQMRPVFTIIDPENSQPTNISQFYAYGNCQSHKPYNTVDRSMRNYTDLGLSKQDKIILKTNGSAAAREFYDAPANIWAFTQEATLGTTADWRFGLCVYTVEYEFSG